MSHIRSQAIPKAHKAFVQYAFFRWESAAVIGGTALLWRFLPRPFPSWPKLGWLILGAIALCAVVLSSLTDMEARTRIQMEYFQQSFKPSEILSPELRQELRNALDSLYRVEVAVNKQPPGQLRDRLDRVAALTADCVAVVFRVVSRLDTYSLDTIQNQQRDSIPKELDTLRARLRYESNDYARTQLESVMESKVKQLEALQALDGRIAQSKQRLRDVNRSLSGLCDRARVLTSQDLSGDEIDQIEYGLNQQLADLNRLMLNISEAYVRL